MIKFEISVDDGCQQDLRIAHLCKKYDIPCTFYIPVDYISLAINKGYEPLDQKAYQYILDNFEIGSHGVTHDYLTRISERQAKDEIFNSKKLLESATGKEINKFCYPRGYANDQIKKWVEQAGYNYARSTAIGNLEAPQDPYFAGTTVHMGCPIRPEYEGTTWLDYAKQKLAECSDDKEYIYHAWGHSWEIDKYNEWNNVKKFFYMIGKINGKS